MTTGENQIIEDNALKGSCILVSRPLQQSAKLVAELKSHGAEVEELALIRISCPDSWEPFDRAFVQLNKYAWLVFASANAAKTTWERTRHLNVNQDLKTMNIACIGPATAATLLDYGITAKLTAANAIAESLIEEFPQAPAESSQMSRRILWPRTNIGRRIIKDSLEKLGWQVDIVHSYKTEGPEDTQACAQRLRYLLQEGRLTAITLTSSETARKLQELISIAFANDSLLARSLLAKIQLAVIGPETARTCQSIFGRVDVQAAEYTARGLVAALIDRCGHKQ